MGAFSSRDATPPEPPPQHHPSVASIAALEGEASCTKGAPPRAAAGAAAAPEAADSNDVDDEHDDDEDINDDGSIADDGNIQTVWGAPEEGPGMWTEELFDDGRGHRLHDSAYYASRSDDDDDDDASWHDEVDSVAAEDDDDEEDREPYYHMDEPRIVRAFHVSEAIASLEDMPGVVEWLEVAMLRPPYDGGGRMRPPYGDGLIWPPYDDDTDDDDADEEGDDEEEVVHVEYSELLRRFVDLLLDPESQSIRELIVYDAHVDKYEEAHRNEMEHLLRDVVPGYRTLQKLAFATLHGGCSASSHLGAGIAHHKIGSAQRPVAVLAARRIHGRGRASGCRERHDPP
jgi:hypothetical protein